MDKDYGLIESILNSSDAGIIVCDLETGSILYVTKNIDDYFKDLNVKEYTGRSCQELFADAAYDSGIRILEKISSGKEYEIVEYFEQRKKCVRAKGKALEYEGKRAMAHYFYDITKEHHLQTSLRNRYYSEITMMSGVSPYALGTYRINLTRNTMEIPLGKTPEGMGFLNPMSVDSLFRFFAGRCGEREEEKRFASVFDRRKLLHEYERGITRFSLEHTFYMETNRIIWITTSVNMAKNVDTGDIEAILYTVDINREKTMEELLNTIADNDYDGVYLIDGEITRAYDLNSIRRHSGHRISESGIPYRKLVERILMKMPKNSDSYLEVFEMLTLENIRRELRRRPNYTVYFDVADEKGMMRHKKSSFYSIDAPGMLICNTIQDISGVVQSAIERQNELQDALEKVQNALNAKNDILYRLNRDIRLPLSAVIGLAEVARLEADKAGETDYLDRIIREGAAIRTIIDDMLDLHRIEHRGVVLVPERLDLAEFFGILEAKLLPWAGERGLRFSIKVGSHVPQQIMADRYRLEQVLTRLLENTFDYNANGESVTLLVTESAREHNRTTLKFSILDTSTGLNAEYLSSVFEPVDPKVIVKIERPEQLDLGLILAKNNLAAMGGRVSVESAEGQGSRVTVTLTFPISYGQGETFLRFAQDEQRGYNFRRGRILLVDDHKISLEIGVKMLEKVGMEVVTAMNGEEAVHTFRDEKGNFDLIFMDIQMPLMDGLEATSIIRSDSALGGDRVPIVAMTANAYEEDIRVSLDAGMNEHLTKPFTPNELYRVMAKFIG